MTDTRKAFGEDVQQPAPDELVRMKGHDGALASGAGGPAQKHISMFVITDESFGREGAALDVAGKVAQGGATTADMFELDVPVFGR